MLALKFTLKGKSAFFKKPDVNTYAYFTYGNIHKVALLGILGAISGYKGYNSQSKDCIYPEFYEKLKDLNVSIVPKQTSANGHPGVFGKKMQTYTNATGCASKETGGTLIVKEQWLENPCWDIYIREDHCCYAEIKERILNNKCVYFPYLGKNDHFADISNAYEVELNEIEGEQVIHSLFSKQGFEAGMNDDFDTIYFKYEEKLPVALEPLMNQYVYETFILTNRIMQPLVSKQLFKAEDKVLCFI